MFWSIKNSGEVLSKLKSRQESSVQLVCPVMISTLYTTLLHNLIKGKLIDLI